MKSENINVIFSWHALLTIAKLKNLRSRDLISSSVSATAQIFNEGFRYNNIINRLPKEFQESRISAQLIYKHHNNYPYFKY